MIGTTLATTKVLRGISFLPSFLLRLCRLSPNNKLANYSQIRTLWIRKLSCLKALPRLHIVNLHRLGRIAHHLRNHILALYIATVAQGQHNRANHRNQQDQT